MAGLLQLEYKKKKQAVYDYMQLITALKLKKKKKKKLTALVITQNIVFNHAGPEDFCKRL